MSNIYWIETGEGAPSEAIYNSNKDSPTVEFPYVNGTNSDIIIDHGNGWRLTDKKGKRIGISYSDVANIVSAFIILQREGHRIYQARIYKGKRVANIQATKRRK